MLRMFGELNTNDINKTNRNEQQQTYDKLQKATTNIAQQRINTQNKHTQTKQTNTT